MQMALLLVIWSPEGAFVRGTLSRWAAPREGSLGWFPGLPVSLIEQIAVNRRIRPILGPCPGYSF